MQLYTHTYNDIITDIHKRNIDTYKKQMLILQARHSLICHLF